MGEPADLDGTHDHETEEQDHWTYKNLPVSFKTESAYSCETIPSKRFINSICSSWFSVKMLSSVSGTLPTFLRTLLGVIVFQRV